MRTEWYFIIMQLCNENDLDLLNQQFHFYNAQICTTVETDWLIYGLTQVACSKLLIETENKHINYCPMELTVYKLFELILFFIKGTANYIVC